MGYETKLIIGYPHTNGSGDGSAEYEKKYGRSYGEIVRIDMSKCGNGPLGQLLSDRIQAHKKLLEAGKTPVTGFYADGGSELVTEDSYGDPVTPVPLVDVAKAVAAELDKAERAHEIPYRRFSTLEEICDDLLQNYRDYELVALTYGH